MTRGAALAVASLVSVLAARTDIHAQAETHRYTIGARVRPLLVFWIARKDMGEAILTRRRAAREARYSLLIGSDPDRTPLHINRWGYIEEEIRGEEARLLGLMTQSDEESVQQAEANVRKQATSAHPFTIINGTTDGQQAEARVVSVNLPEDYTVRQASVVLDVAKRAVHDGKLRVIAMPPGTRPGFLAALSDAMRLPQERTITYVYYGKLYDLRRTHSSAVPSFRIGARDFGPAVAADFVIVNRKDGEQTKFSMTYGTSGGYVEVPLAVTYQPRWWIQVDLTIDDAPAAQALRMGSVR
jgi:hypothetical protein